MAQKRILILWAKNDTRSDSLAYHLGAKSYHISYFKLNKTNRFILVPLRYLLASIKTFLVLLREHPDRIIVVNPPVIAILIVWLYCNISGSRFITDSHSATFNIKRWKLFIWLFRFLAKQAVTNIVHNEPLAQLMSDWGLRSQVIGDIPYQLISNMEFHFKNDFNVVFVCTFAPDEPVEIVMDAAKELPKVHFYITGDLNYAEKSLLLGLPSNVSFTGYLPDAEYVSLIKNCNIVTSLTTRDLTMQNGAFEALELGIPIITSNWPVLQSTFSKGAVLIDNTSMEYVTAIKEIQQNYSTYCEQISILRSERWLVWNEEFHKILRIIDDKA